MTVNQQVTPTSIPSSASACYDHLDSLGSTLIPVAISWQGVFCQQGFGFRQGVLLVEGMILVTDEGLHLSPITIDDTQSIPDQLMGFKPSSFSFHGVILFLCTFLPFLLCTTTTTYHQSNAMIQVWIAIASRLWYQPCSVIIS